MATSMSLLTSSLPSLSFSSQISQKPHVSALSFTSAKPFSFSKTRTAVIAASAAAAPSPVDFETADFKQLVKSRLPGGFAAQTIFGTGRRKSAIARVVLQEGSDKIILNYRDDKPRVRLWKPMVEDIYKEDIKEEEQQEETTTVNLAANELAKSDSNSVDKDHPNQNQNNIVSAQTPMCICNCKITSTISSSSTTTVPLPLVEARKSEINAPEKDPSKNTINYGQYTLENQAILQSTPTTTLPSDTSGHHDQTLPTYGCFTAIPEAVGLHDNITARATNNFTASSLVGIGTSQAGDVSLTLGLRHP